MCLCIVTKKDVQHERETLFIGAGGWKVAEGRRTKMEWNWFGGVARFFLDAFVRVCTPSPPHFFILGFWCERRKMSW